jgi:ATP-dependent DNA helicase RecG
MTFIFWQNTLCILQSAFLKNLAKIHNVILVSEQGVSEMRIKHGFYMPDYRKVESLKRSHPSKPRNLLIADVCFKGGLIDTWGRGTIRIIDTCKAAKLPDPEFIEQDGGFLVTLFKDEFSEEQLRYLNLNDRQIKAVLYAKEKGKITNNEYQELNNTINKTALRDLNELVSLNIFKREGEGKNTYYRI